MPVGDSREVVVVDASVLVRAGVDPRATALRERLKAAYCHAPHLVDAEFGDVLRRLVHIGRVEAADAPGILETAPQYIDERHEQIGNIAAAAWRLRHNVTFYDALYVALATALDATLLTADGPLSRAPGLTCEVELIEV